ncbi:MAG: ABC transporter permease, partial [Pseudomonadota bacterium]
MNVAAPQSSALRWIYNLYLIAFFIYLAAPLAAAAVFAFNDSLFPTLPWKGFTLDWFFNDTEPKLGMFHDRRLLRGLQNSLFVGLIVSAMSVAAGTTNAFLFERRNFPGKQVLYIFMIVPLVIPGVILGISILVLASSIANSVEETFGYDWSLLRPGLFLVILGQFSFLTTITSLVIAARLRKFDIS